MLEVEAGGLLLVRFSPMHADGIAADAELSADDCAAQGEARVYSISTFGLVRASDETVDDLVLRICEQSSCGGKTIWPVAESTVRGAGFGVQLSEPPPNHYNVVLGTELRVPDVEKLVSCFGLGRRRNPSWKKKAS